MLDLVTAQRFDKRMGSGKSRPCLLACERADGSEVEVVTKFSAGLDRREGGLVIEAIAALLAAELDLPIPEPFLVAIDDDFIDSLPATAAEDAQRMRASNRLAIGLEKLPPGFALWPSGRPVPAAIRPQAAEIFAFDCLIENGDRMSSNPNLLFDGRSFAIFDHELTFMKDLLGRRPPWEPGSLQGGARLHVLFAGLAGRSYDWSRLEGAWEAISDSWLDSCRAALPGDWQLSQRVADEALAYLKELRDNVRPALAEVARVLS